MSTEDHLAETNGTEGESSKLSTREFLQSKGFYDVLEGRPKDFPPELSALKEHEQRGNVDMVLLALEKLGMDYMQQYCFSALKRMGDASAIGPMIDRASRRDKSAIEVLGKIGSEKAVDSILSYVDNDSNPQLQFVTLRALGEIGSSLATQSIANKLTSENEQIRSSAARSLGMIGDTRAIGPLSLIVSNDTYSFARYSAIWALVQIRTYRALEIAKSYSNDPDYLVQSEAIKASELLGSS
jgi:HEAT repeat protein